MKILERILRRREIAPTSAEVKREGFSPAIREPLQDHDCKFEDVDSIARAIVASPAWEKMVSIDFLGLKSVRRVNKSPKAKDIYITAQCFSLNYVHFLLEKQFDQVNFHLIERQARQLSEMLPNPQDVQKLIDFTEEAVFSKIGIKRENTALSQSHMRRISAPPGQSRA